MATQISTKKSSTPGKSPVPADLSVGELAINLADAVMYSKNGSGEVIDVESRLAQSSVQLYTPNYISATTDFSTNPTINNVNIATINDVVPNAVDSVNNKTGIVVLDASDVGAVSSVNGQTGVVTGLQETASKGLADGYAGLDGTGKVPVEQLPQVATQTGQVYVVQTIAQRDTLTVVEGDVAIVTDTAQSYIATTAGEGASVWAILGNANVVNSVNGDSGIVTITTSSIGAATTAQGSLADSATQPSDNVSTLTNDANYIDSAGAPVQTVNGHKGSVVLTAGEIGGVLPSELGLTTTGIGWRLEGVDPANYGPVGEDAVDLSLSITATPNGGATGKWSFAEGYQTRASGQASHSEGWETIADGLEAHAEGDATHAHGHASHSEGHDSHANGDFSHAQGTGTVAQNDSQDSAGAWNVGTHGGTLHEFGIGTDDANRKNAFEIYANGAVKVTNGTFEALEDVAVGGNINSVGYQSAGDTNLATYAGRFENNDASAATVYTTQWGTGSLASFRTAIDPNDPSAGIKDVILFQNDGTISSAGNIIATEYYVSAPNTTYNETDALLGAAGSVGSNHHNVQDALDDSPRLGPETANTYASSNNFTGVIQKNGVDLITSAGAPVQSVNGSTGEVNTATVAQGALADSAAQLGATQAFTGTNSFNGGLISKGEWVLNSVNGVHSDEDGLINLTPANIDAGGLLDSNTWSGPNNFSGTVVVQGDYIVNKINGIFADSTGGMTLTAANVGAVAPTDYATATTGGTMKMRIDGSDLYISTTGADA